VFCDSCHQINPVEPPPPAIDGRENVALPEGHADDDATIYILYNLIAALGQTTIAVWRAAIQRTFTVCGRPWQWVDLAQKPGFRLHAEILKPASHRSSVTLYLLISKTLQVFDFVNYFTVTNLNIRWSPLPFRYRATKTRLALL
jgi:hypothetical protein